MGIPGFFKWLTDKYHYPDIVKPCIEYDPFYDKHGVYQPLDLTQSNPNRVEFDNLYLDLNGVIHFCANSDHCSVPKNEDEIVKSIFKSIDQIFSIVRPRKLVYIAVDGVAPRAKLNQQRSRRFRDTKDALEKTEEIEKIKSQIRADNGLLPEDQNQIEAFDENCITPGTSFMSRLSNYLRYYIYNRMNKNSAWKSLRVILSDSSVPGEGEHKIINFIRQQSLQPSYDPYTYHVIYGTDADLILLGLATREQNIIILRNEFNFNTPRVCDVCRQIGHDMKQCKGISKDIPNQNNTLSSATSNDIKTKYIFVDLSILRSNLCYLLGCNQSQFQWDYQRFIDDWVFMCLLVGNDFLPNSPSLEVHESAIDELFYIYMLFLPSANDYLTDNGQLNISLLETILIEFGKNEDKKFQDRHKLSQQFQNNRQAINASTKPSLNLDEIKSVREKPMPTKFGPPSFKKSVEGKTQSSEIQSNNSAVTTSSNNQFSNETKREVADSSISNQQETNDPADTVRLWEEGWHERYYKNKFNVDEDHLDEIRVQVVTHYVEGLCWVLQYYYHGVPSWDWYYPHHYAPFASDFSNLNNISVYFNEYSQPFKPLEQLISVLPSQHAKYLPETWQSLLLEKDSPIIDFYPTDFSIDPNGKRYKNQYTTVLPFIDEQRLHKVLEQKYSLLTLEEKNRNEYDNGLLFIHSEDSFYHQLKQELDRNHSTNDPFNIPSMIGIFGQSWRDDNDDQIIPIGKTVIASITNYSNITNNKIMCVKYHDSHI